MRPIMGLGRGQWGTAFLAAAGWLLCMAPGRAQVFVVGPEHIAGVPPFQSTHVELKQVPLTALGHQTLITAFTAEQGFARRPLPLGAHGLVLRANGDMDPGGNDYARALQKFGVSAKTGDRVVITDVRIEGKRIIFDLP